ncbi:hypothetical protein ACFL3F_05390, partial [Planctomycetota bacterium]
DISAIDNFLKIYPDSGFATQARQRRIDLIQAEDNKTFEEAKERGNAKAFQAYLESHPKGRHVIQAKQELARVIRLKEDIRNSCLNIGELRPGNPGNKLPGVYVKNGSYKIFRSRYNTTGIEITGGNGGLEAQGGLPGGAGDNFVYRFTNKSTIIAPGGRRIILEGDSLVPITFVLTADQGLVYLEGNGKVTINNKTVMLPCEKNKI